jgi:hypothetical protein
MDTLVRNPHADFVTSFFGSIEAMPPSVSAAPGAPPFSLVSSNSIP